MIFICDYGNFVQKTTTTNELDIAMTTAASTQKKRRKKKAAGLFFTRELFFPAAGLLPVSSVGLF